MGTKRALALIAVMALVTGAGGSLSVFSRRTRAVARADTAANVAVGPQYDTAHVYVAAEDFDRFVASALALTPAGTSSVFGFRTPIPYPFGSEGTGYLVTDLDAAIAAARTAGADVLVSVSLSDATKSLGQPSDCAILLDVEGGARTMPEPLPEVPVAEHNDISSAAAGLCQCGSMASRNPGRI